MRFFNKEDMAESTQHQIIANHPEISFPPVITIEHVSGLGYVSWSTTRSHPLRLASSCSPARSGKMAGGMSRAGLWLPLLRLRFLSQSPCANAGSHC